ncbi:Sensor histidine kinase YehU [compost metagenome]
MTKHTLHILLFLTCCFSGHTQELLFSNISNEFSIPSQECYKILQDRRGYIWFSTDNGLCRYGNGSLKIFDARNGLPEENVYAMSEDQKGRLWFATSDNRILYYDKGKLIEAPFNQSYQKPAIKERSNPIPLMLDMWDPENSYITNYYYSSRIKQSINSAYLIPTRDSTVSLVFQKTKGHPFIPTQLKKTDEKFRTLLLSNEQKDHRVTLFDLPVNKSFSWYSVTAFSGVTDFIAIHKKLLKVNADLHFSAINFPGRILSLYTDKSNGLWVGVENNGLYYYPDIHTMKQGHHSLSNFSVTGICEDQENGIWCTTLEKGVFYCRNKFLISYNSLDGLNKNMTLLKYTDGSLFASSSSQAIFRWRNQKLETYDLRLKNTRFSDIIRDRKDWILSGKETVIRTNSTLNSKTQLVFLPYHTFGCKELVKGRNDQIFGFLAKNVLQINSINLITVVNRSNRLISQTIIHKKGDVFFLGGDQGLYEFNVVTLQYRKIKGVPEKVRKIIRTRSGRIWIATKNDGIYWLDGEKVTNATQLLGLKTFLFYDLAEDPAGTVWAGSNQGLYRFSSNGGKYQTSCYTISHGLPSSDVYKVAADSEKIWFSTYEGLFNLPLETSSLNTAGPAIHLQKLSVKNKPVTDLSGTFRFTHDLNNLHFTFDILTFKNGSNTKLEYLLEYNGLVTATKLDGNEVFLENLDPGTYELTVFGVNNDGVRSSNPEIFLITIDSPFWQTWWFILLASLIILLFIFLTVRLIISSIRKKEEAKTLVNKLMAEYQITALQAQMNPHFIFNAINTIQGYILEKNEDEAYNYLAKFGKLIRKVLHHSQEKVLLLEVELEVLQLYVELEQLRFDHCFDYELTISENVFPEDIYLPGMILQPYLENAIWHGIVNLRESRRGKLEVFVKRENKVLLVLIKDNGIGREMAMSFNKDRRHKSVGMKLTGERLHAMNQLHGYETASVTITDLFDQDGEASGTSVEVSIPINTET